ncbi:MAG: hypothetical protein ACR2Q4_18990 [Geminicoccaceae bacterium]
MNTPFPFHEFSSRRESSNPCARHRTDDIFPYTDFGRGGQDDACGKQSKRSYTAEEFAEAIDETRRATTIEVEARTRAALEADLSARQTRAMEAVREQLATTGDQIEGWIDAVSKTSYCLALGLAKAIVPRALEGQPLSDIEDMLRDTIASLFEQPSLELRLPPDIIEQGQALLDRLGEEVGYRGRLVAVADPTIGTGDAKLLWQGGVADRNVTELKEKASALVAAWLPVNPLPSLERDTQPLGDESPPPRKSDAISEDDEGLTDGSNTP